MSKLCAGIAVICTLIAGADKLQAQIVSKAETLRGHSRVLVIAELASGDDDIAKLGLKSETMTSFVIDRLNKSGVKAVGVTGREDDDGLFLEIVVNILKVGPSYVFSLQANAHQFVVLAKTMDVALAITWSRGHYGSLGIGNPAPVREGMEQAVDAFAKDWKTAHKPADDPFRKPADDPFRKLNAPGSAALKTPNSTPPTAPASRRR